MAVSQVDVLESELRLARDVIQNNVIREKRLQAHLADLQAPFRANEGYLNKKIAKLQEELNKANWSLKYRVKGQLQSAPKEELEATLRISAGLLLEAKIKPIFAGDRHDSSNVENVTFEWQGFGHVRITVHQMYDYVKVTPDVLTRLSFILGTEKIDIGEKDADGGCESCDHGSDFRVTFDVFDVDVFSIALDPFGE